MSQVKIRRIDLETSNLAALLSEIAQLEHGYVRSDFRDDEWRLHGGFHVGRDAEFWQDFLRHPTSWINAVFVDGIVVGFHAFVLGSPFPVPAKFPSVGGDDKEYGDEPMFSRETLADYVSGVTLAEVAFSYTIATDPQYVRQGIARELYQKFDELCKMGGFKLAVAELLALPQANLASKLFHVGEGWSDVLLIRDSEAFEHEDGMTTDISWAIYLKVVGDHQVVHDDGKHWVVK